MLPVLLTSVGSLGGEIANSIGKFKNKQRQESIYTIAFLSVFCGALFFAISISIFHAKFIFATAAIPFVTIRIAIEVLNSFVCSNALIRAERSSLSFLSLTAIPLILVFDILFNYRISSWQIAGVLLLFFTLLLLYQRIKRSRKGMRWALASAFTQAAAATALKFDIAHYNSVAAEQLIVMGSMSIILFAMALTLGHENPIKKMAQHPVIALQSLSQGTGLSITSFAYTFAPASVIFAMSRAFGLMWSIIFGHIYFHEQKLHERLKAFGIAVLAIALLAIKP